MTCLKCGLQSMWPSTQSCSCDLPYLSVSCDVTGQWHASFTDKHEPGTAHQLSGGQVGGHCHTSKLLPVLCLLTRCRAVKHNCVVDPNHKTKRKHWTPICSHHLLFPLLSPIFSGFLSSACSSYNRSTLSLDPESIHSHGERPGHQGPGLRGTG